MKTIIRKIKTAADINDATAITRDLQALMADLTTIDTGDLELEDGTMMSSFLERVYGELGRASDFIAAVQQMFAQSRTPANVGPNPAGPVTPASQAPTQ